MYKDACETCERLHACKTCNANSNTRLPKGREACCRGFFCKQAYSIPLSLLACLAYASRHPLRATTASSQTDHTSPCADSLPVGVTVLDGQSRSQCCMRERWHEHGNTAFFEHPCLLSCNLLCNSSCSFQAARPFQAFNNSNKLKCCKVPRIYPSFRQACLCLFRLAWESCMHMRAILRNCSACKTRGQHMCVHRSMLRRRQRCPLISRV